MFIVEMDSFIIIEQIKVTISNSTFIDLFNDVLKNLQTPGSFIINDSYSTNDISLITSIAGTMFIEVLPNEDGFHDIANIEKQLCKALSNLLGNFTILY